MNKLGLSVLIVLAGAGILFASLPSVSSPANAYLNRQEATPTPVPMSEEMVMPLAMAGVSSNGEWVPYIKEFDGVEMVLVPAGSFVMGSTDEEIDAVLALCNRFDSQGQDGCLRDWFTDEAPTSEQTIAEPLWVDRTEVTRAMYQACVETGACTEVPASDYSTQPNQPINRVTWFQAGAYCEWRGEGYRLPTEAEWEYVARGPDHLMFPWGDAYDGTMMNACDSNCKASSWGADYRFFDGETDDGYSETAPVGSYEQGASWVGALDMSGNVLEWTSSLYESYPYKSDDGREDLGETKARVIRGGSFHFSPFYSRAATRNRYTPSSGGNYIGFRCVRSR